MVREEKYRKALEEVANLGGIKNFEADYNSPHAALGLFSLVCKLKNIAKAALNDEANLLESPTLESLQNGTNIGTSWQRRSDG